MATTNRQRDKGSGSVFKLTNGKWRAQVKINGKPVARQCATEALARRALKELLAQQLQVKETGTIAPANLTVSDVINAWFEFELPNRELAPRSVWTYEAQAAHLHREVGRLHTATLRVRPLDEAFARLAKDHHLSKATLVKCRSVLSMAFEFAIKREEMTKNLAGSITFPTTAASAKPGSSLDVDQAKAFLELVRGHRFGSLFVTAVNLGLRPGELRGLCWEHVDLDGDVPTLSVERAMRTARNGANVLSDDLKTARARRTIALPPYVLAALREHRNDQRADDLATGVRPDPNFVWRTSNGTALQQSNLTREFKKVMKEMGLGTEWSPNDLRHTAASLLVDQGVPLVVVADILGHTTTRMLEQTYRKNLRPQITGGVAAMTGLFGAG